MDYRYEKLDENYIIVQCPIDDKDGSVTGKIILNVPAYFDENPDIRKALGWVKHITHTVEECVPSYDKATQFVVADTKQVDEYTIEDTYHVLDKSEEQLAFEEMLSVATGGSMIWFS